MKHEDMLHKRYGRLVVTEIIGRQGYTFFCRVLCDCGASKRVCVYSLLSGASTSCGCLRKEMVITRNKTTLKRHGESSKAITPEYRSWTSMLCRCFNKNATGYHNYGGRGITVCKRWLTYTNFIEDMGRKPSKQHTLDRINNNKGYCKSNCRWADKTIQSQNSRTNKNITFKNKTMCMAAWERELGMRWGLLHDRFSRGWTIEQALTTPVGAK